jgi:hypothetical protein
MGHQSEPVFQSSSTSERVMSDESFLLVSSICGEPMIDLEHRGDPRTRPRPSLWGFEKKQD